MMALVPGMRFTSSGLRLLKAGLCARRSRSGAGGEKANLTADKRLFETECVRLEVIGDFADNNRCFGHIG